MGIGSGMRHGAATVALAVAVVACGSTPPTSSVASPDAGVPVGRPVSATNQADGVIVTLALSSDRVIAGDRIRLRISALNAGLGPVAYEAGGCGPIMGIVVSGPTLPPRAVDDPPQGTGGAAVLELAKWSALSQGGTQLDWIRTEGMPDDAAMACTADLRYEEIAPGETFTDEAVWIARIGDGAPAPAGEYRVDFGFPFAGRRSKDDVPFEGQVVTPITVAVPLAVEAGPKMAVDAEAAIDAAITDPEVAAWAQRSLTRERLEGATMTMIDGRWRWRIQYAGGQTDVFVDPVTGEVVETRIGP
jgi:hypothetical protein